MKFVLTLLLTICLALLLVFVAFRGLEHWGARVHAVPAAVEFVLHRGESLTSLSETLRAKGIIDNATLFKAWVKVHSSYEQFQAGRYQLSDSYSWHSMSMKMRRGEVYEPELLRFTIPEGFTLSLTAKRIAAKTDIAEQDLLHLAYDKRFLKKLNVPGASLEGYLYPATYSFSTVPSAAEILQRMVRTFWKFLPQGYESAVQQKGLTLHEAVTFASLIELETHHDSERALVSEVIWNRLNRKIALAIDASIIYGIADYAGDLKRIHLEDATNPYNTRKHRGLPPGPIGSPSQKSLRAVLEPSNEGYYYYVVDFNTGKHNFSKSLAQHNRYVAKMLRDRRESRR